MAPQPGPFFRVLHIARGRRKLIWPPPLKCGIVSAHSVKRLLMREALCFEAHLGLAF
jgi:hypothetical protein